MAWVHNSQVTQAFEVLSNPTERSRYDATRRTRRSAGGFGESSYGHYQQNYGQARGTRQRRYAQEDYYSANNRNTYRPRGTYSYEDLLRVFRELNGRNVAEAMREQLREAARRAQQQRQSSSTQAKSSSNYGRSATSRRSPFGVSPEEFERAFREAFGQTTYSESRGGGMNADRVETRREIFRNSLGQNFVRETTTRYSADGRVIGKTVTEEPMTTNRFSSSAFQSQMRQAMYVLLYRAMIGALNSFLQMILGYIRRAIGR